MAEKRPEVIWPLLGPYLCWITFATALNAEVLRLNPDVSTLTLTWQTQLLTWQTQSLTWQIQLLS